MDQKSTSQHFFNLEEDIYKSFYHAIFFEVCKLYQIVPDGLYVEKELCIGNPIKKLLDAWKNQLEVTRSNHGTIIRTGIKCKKIPFYMRDSACRWLIVKNIKIF